MRRGALVRAKVSVLGHFGEGKTLLNGQTVKTKIITEELQAQLGQGQVLKFDTHGGWKTLLKAPLQAFQALKRSENVLIFPAHNGLRVYAPLLLMEKAFFKKRKLHYVVIGGWLPQFLSKRRVLTGVLKKFDGIYVETNTMKAALEAKGFGNIVVLPNCKKLTVLSADALAYPVAEPYRLCTFSRVMKEKGIEDAVDAVVKVNQALGRQAYSLDIYGQVDAAQTKWFHALRQTFPPYIRYGGEVPFDKSVEVLKDYVALLFPTKFYTEGIPGTIIDAYAAGVPVIASMWESYSDMIDESTGIGYPFDKPEELVSILAELVEKPELLSSRKANCLERAAKYRKENVICILTEKLL